MAATSRRPRLIVATALASLALAGGVSDAHAGPLVRSATACDSLVFEQPFARWLDFANYFLVPGGALETGSTGWKLSKASIVAGNETYYVRAAADRNSLALPAGSSATTPSMCVGIDTPVLRLFVRNKGPLTSTLKVEVLYEDAGGTVRSLAIAKLTGTSSWQPTLQIPVVANLLPLLPGERTAVAFRFTPAGKIASWAIDDLYVDPHRRG